MRRWIWKKLALFQEHRISFVHIWHTYAARFQHKCPSAPKVSAVVAVGASSFCLRRALASGEFFKVMRRLNFIYTHERAKICIAASARETITQRAVKGRIGKERFSLSARPESKLIGDARDLPAISKLITHTDEHYHVGRIVYYSALQGRNFL